MDAICTVCGETNDVKSGIPYIWHDAVYEDEVCKDCRSCPDCGEDYRDVGEGYWVTGSNVHRTCKCGYEEWYTDGYRYVGVDLP